MQETTETDSSSLTNGLEAWISRMKNQQLPAVTSTAHELESLAQKDTSTLGQLGQVLLKDAALTSQILKVANSVIYNPTGRSVDTLSNAAIVLGFQQLRSVCVTAKLLTDLLKSGKLTAPVHERLLGLVAGSLHTAVQARSLIGDDENDNDDEMREQVFIAALLSDLGASAFWAMGGEETETLDLLLLDSEVPPEDVVDEYLGTSFEDLSIGLAESWNLGSTLIDTLKASNVDDPAVRAVRLGRQISESIARNGWNSEETKQIIKQVAKLLKLSEREARKRLSDNIRETKKLARCYGAGAITEFLPSQADSPPPPNTRAASRPVQPDQAVQLRVLRDLTAMMGEKPDFNRIIHVAMEGIHQGIGMDRTLTALIGNDGKNIVGRFAIGNDQQKWVETFKFVLGAKASLFKHCLDTNAPAWFDAAKTVSQRSGLGAELYRFCAGRSCMLAPIRVARRPIAFLYADRQPSEREVSVDDFAAFSHFSQQVNLCFSAISRGK